MSVQHGVLTPGVRSDQTVRLTGEGGHAHHPMHLRRVRCCDPATARALTFLTNAFAPPALTIAALYKRRWQIELFFKWIKQHLRDRRRCGRDTARGPPHPTRRASPRPAHQPA